MNRENPHTHLEFMVAVGTFTSQGMGFCVVNLKTLKTFKTLTVGMYNIEKAVITCGGGCGPSQQAEGGRGGRKTGSLGSV